MLGHWSLVLFPLGPWQATQVAALVAPAAASPEPAAIAIGAVTAANINPAQRIIGIICSQLQGIEELSPGVPGAAVPGRWPAAPPGPSPAASSATLAGHRVSLYPSAQFLFSAA